MSRAYLVKKRKADKLQRDLDKKLQAEATAAALKVQRQLEHEAAEVRREQERAKRLAEWESLAYERDLAKLVRMRGGMFCGHGSHRRRGRSHRSVPEATPVRRSSWGRMQMTMALVMAGTLGSR